MSDSFRPHESQHARPPCPSPTPGVHSDSRPLSQWCHPAISSSVVPFFSCLQSFPASGSFPMSQLFSSGGQSIGASASTSVLPMIYSGHYMWNKQKKTLKVERRHFSLGRTAGSVEQHDGEFSGFSFCLKYSMDIELKQPIIQKCQWRQTNKVPALSENQEKSSRAKQKTCRQ